MSVRTSALIMSEAAVVLANKGSRREVGVVSGRTSSSQLKSLFPTTVVQQVLLWCSGCKHICVDVWSPPALGQHHQPLPALSVVFKQHLVGVGVGRWAAPFSHSCL